MTPYPTLAFTRIWTGAGWFMIVLHTLGDTLITVGERKVRPSSPLVFAALLYLATERGRRVPRAALRELFFPESDERSGAHSVRQLLYKLRQLGAPIEADPTAAYVAPEHVRDDTQLAGSSESMSAVYLADYAPEISERYSDWLERRRGEVAAAMRKRLVASIEANRDALNWSAVERDARCLLVLDPYNEVATLAVAEATALTGSKASALQLLSDYERDTGLAGLHLPASILRRRILATLPDTAHTPLGLPFTGRDVEVQELRSLITTARSGTPHMYVVSGEAGLGKTRLVTETASLAALEGVSVVTVRCQPHYANRPMSVFIDFVPILLTLPGALGVSPRSLASLTSLTSHSHDYWDPPFDKQEDTTRSDLLLRAIHDLVEAVTCEQTLLMIVDDSHWADNDSMRELQRLIQSPERRPLIVVCTTRMPAPPLEPHLADRITVRRLKPLTTEAMTTLADSLLSHRVGDADQDFITWSVRASGGNPLFLQLLCTHNGSTTGPYTIPSDVSSAVIRRVQQLPEAEQRLLCLCALVGKHGTVELLRSLSGMSYPQLVDHIARLEDQGFLVLAEDRICVAHFLLGETAVALLQPVARRVIHGSVAAALEQRYEVTRDAALLWDCAEQWILSGESSKAIRFLLTCARYATKIGSATEALKLLSRAEELSRHREELMEVVRASVGVARAAGDWRGAWQQAERLRVLADSSVCKHSPIEMLALEAQWTCKFDASVVDPLWRCLTDAASTLDHKIDAAHLLLRIAHETARCDLAERAFGSIAADLHRARPSHSSRTMPIIYHACFGDIDEAMALAHDFARQLTQLGSITDELRGAYSLFLQFALVGESEAAIALAKCYYDKCGAMGLVNWQYEFALYATTIHNVLEDFDGARLWHSRTLALSALLPGGGQPIRELGNELELAIARSDRAEATRLLDLIQMGDLGDSLRGRGYFIAARVRVLQLDPQYRVDDQTLAEMLRISAQAQHLFCADALAIAICEALVRRDQFSEATTLLRSYVGGLRRERSPIPPSLRRYVNDPRLCLIAG